MVLWFPLQFNRLRMSLRGIRFLKLVLAPLLFGVHNLEAYSYQYINIFNSSIYKFAFIEKAPIKSYWLGNKVVSASVPILVLAGHADSQGIYGSGTSGEGVALNGLAPMDENMSDELFWNLKICHEVVSLGKKNGLNINFYDPKVRTILDGNDERTNWSVGARFAQKGWYVIEIHFDSYGEYGFGSGLIVPVSTKLNNIDESLARKFGRYPMFFRGALGGPRRQIRLLEIAKLEGPLEERLRNPQTRKTTIKEIAFEIVQAIKLGVNKKDPFNPQLQKGDIFLPNFYR